MKAAVLLEKQAGRMRPRDSYQFKSANGHGMGPASTGCFCGLTIQVCAHERYSAQGYYSQGRISLPVFAPSQSP